MTRSARRGAAVSTIMVFLAVPAGAEFQIDIRGGWLTGIEDTAWAPGATNPAALVAGYLSGTVSIGRHFSLVGRNHADLLFVLADKAADSLNESPYIDRFVKVPAAAERQYYGFNDAYAGIRANPAGRLEVGYGNYAYQGAIPRNLHIDDYFNLTADPGAYLFVKRTLRHTLMGSYELDHDVIVASIGSRLMLNHGEIDSVISGADGADSIAATRDDLDRILRTRATAGIRIPVIGAKVCAGVLLQNHIGRAASFDIYDYHAALSGDADLFDNRFAYRIQGDFYRQDYLTDTTRFPQPITTGFFQTFYLRDSYTPAPGLMLKGLAVLTLGKDVVKQRYEFAFRKAWQSETWLDIGYFTTMGVLFPEQGTYLRTAIRPVEKLGIGLTGKAVWSWADTAKGISQVTYLKSTCNAEISYRIVEPVEAYLGGDFTYFNRRFFEVSGFPSRYSLHAGTRAFF